VGPYGPQRKWRSVVVSTTDPKGLPDKARWYLRTNLPHPDSEQAAQSELEAADLAEVVRLYGLRMWVEQSYKQVKHVLGWSDYQVRSDPAIRRHWQAPLAACVLCLLVLLVGLRAPADRRVTREDQRSSFRDGREGKKESQGILAGGLEGGKGMAGALDNARQILEGVLRDAPTSGARSAA
jgi:hypothetical protein